MHFFSPAHIMKLVECIMSVYTSEEAAVTSMLVIKKMKKIGILMRDNLEKAGFVGNRMIFPYVLESMLLLEGDSRNNIRPVSITLVDFVIRKFGFLMGPFEMQDMSGLDVGYSIRKEFRDAVKPHSTASLSSRYSKIGDELYLAGRMGSKNKLGYYNYADPKNKTVDAAVLSILSNCSQPLNKPVIEKVTNYGIDLSETDILERLLYPIINEGFKVLEDLLLVSNRPGDIDIIYAYGNCYMC